MRIACIGNAAYDIIVSGEKFIEEGIRNNFIGAIFSAGGPALNAASVIAKFGGDVDFYGKVGNDFYGRYILETLYTDGINIEKIKISKETMTPLSFVIINTEANTRTINVVRSEEDFKNPKIGNIEPRNDYDYILTDGKYIEETKKLIQANPNAKTIIDAGRANSDVIELCKIVDYIICSEDFANEVIGLKIDKDKDLVYSKMKELFPTAKEIVITVGKKGYICKKNEEVINFPAHELDDPVVDTNAAGDIYHGAFTYAISNGYDFYQSLEFANITASLSTTKKGGRDSCPDLEEVESIFAGKNKILIKKLKENKKS